MSKSQASWLYPAYIAHRGGGRLAPENTLAGMRVGAQHGFTFCEYDVKLSKDNVLVLVHDDNVDRCSNGHGAVAGLTFEELSRLDAGSWRHADFAGERIPTFEQVARYTQDHGMASNVEIKPSPGRENETGTAVALACRQLWQGAAVPPLLSSFSEEALAAAHVAAPELPRALLLDTIVPDWRDRMIQHDAVALNVNHKLVDQALIDAVHEAGYRIAAYTVNDPERARALLAMGLDGLFTDELEIIRPGL
jgi:glycerophosphoryl diester phosphodiesterase